MARHQLPLPRAGAVARPPVRARRLALDGAAARGRGARDRHPPGGARAVQLPAAVQGREALAGGARPGLRAAAAASWPRRRARPRSSSTSRASRWTARRASSTRSRTRGPRCAPRRSSSAWRRTSRPPIARVFALRRRRGPRRPRARAGAAARGAGDAAAGSRSACSTAATCGPPTSTRRSTGSTPRWRRSAPIGSRSRRRARSCTSRTRPRARPSRSGRGWRSRPRSWTSWACLKAALDGDRDALLERPREVRNARRAAALDAEVRRRTPGAYERDAPFEVRRAAQRARSRAAGAADDDDRLLPADARDPRGAHAAGLRALPGAHDRRGDRPPGARRPRRARARRARAQGHGRALRRAAERLRVLRARLGAVLRLALREAADPLRRRLATRSR